MEIRRYDPPDRPVLEKLMMELQQHIADLDPHKRNRPASDFDVSAYVTHMLTDVEREQGRIMVADLDGVPVGFIVGTIPAPDKEDLLDHYPSKEGKIDELIVSAEHRGKDIGKLLVKAMEDYLQEQGCEYIRVGVFAPNTSAHRFYEKCGYTDRYTEVLKKL